LGQDLQGTSWRGSGPAAGQGRRLLAVASSGGHFKQLVSLVQRIPGSGSITWLTYDVGLSQELLAGAGRGDDRLVFAPYAAPRDVVNLARDARVALRLLREERFDMVVSTGAGIAVATLPAARAMGARAVFIESATRAEGPSMSGRILERVPGVELYTQNPGYRRRWRDAGSVHDSFEPGPERALRALQRVVVTLGTIRPYGFRRLLRRLVAVLPEDVEVLWQTGSTDTTGLPISARGQVAGPELEAAIRRADLVIAHAGTGTALTAFESGQCPVLVPRRQAAGEHIDDHQVVTARALAERGLAVYAEVDDIALPLLVEAASRSVVRRATVPDLQL
jgi:UDP-N-acetylglucosamine--N-acetylmuramyl-(pentapeptide) pyrophosphoryl-undecaprenol N-acetylglucosamine transferase